MEFPLSFWDLSLWMAAMSILLLATSEVLSARHGTIGILIDRSRLRYFALGFGAMGFFATIFCTMSLLF